jgi:hypothetical protein
MARALNEWLYYAPQNPLRGQRVDTQAAALLEAFGRLKGRTNRPQTFMEIASYPHYENACSNFLAFYPAFVVSAFALSIITTWVYNSTGGSLLMIVFLHATVNLPLTLVRDDLGPKATVPVLLYFGLLVVAAVVVVVVAGPKHLSRKHKKQVQEEEQQAAEPGVAAPPGVAKPTPA